MDIFYMGDTLPFQPSMRGPVARDFEKFPIGTLERSSQIKSAYCVAQAKQKHQEKEHGKKGKCPFCKEQKKKPLAVYMRRRQFSKRNDSICEEDEEEEEEEVEEAVEAKEQENTKVDEKK